MKPRGGPPTQPRKPQPPRRPPAPQSPRAAEPPRRALPVVTDVGLAPPDGLPTFAPWEATDDRVLCAVATVRIGDARSLRVDAAAMPLRKGDPVAVESERGVEVGVVTAAPRRELVAARPVARCLRRAGEADLRAEKKARLREAEAVRAANRAAEALRMPVKVVRAECAMGGGRTVIHLASEERVELRELAKRLSATLQGRVELRHVGVRDAAKAIGGVGPCGLQLCCNTFLSDFAPVSIRHAKEQGLALNPQRVSGVCGRLMCCLVYEDAFYRQQRALFPKHGKRVMTPRGEGRVRDVDVLARVVRVAFPDMKVESFSVDEVRALSGDAAHAGGEGDQPPPAPRRTSGS